MQTQAAHPSRHADPVPDRLGLAGAGLAALYIAKRRQQSVCDNWEDGDDDEY